MKTPTHYLRNRDFLAEIHASKKTFCSYLEARYADYDLIVLDPSEITPEALAGARAKKGEGEIVIRIMTAEHVPTIQKEPTRKFTQPVAVPVKTNFPPFKHYVVDDAGGLIEVGRSHWRGGFQNGEFCQTHGSMTNRLATMFMLLVDRYARRPNWKGYSYLDEMKGRALLLLAQNGLKFNEAKSSNPFAFYTQCMSNCFVRVQNEEKKAQNIRDELLETGGRKPSLSRQMSEMGGF